jgi:putative secretion ATPase (PEP-CTERM system associated)
MYEQFYGLTGRPFQLTPDPDFYYESTSHKKALSYLGYGLSQGEGFMIVTGEVGAGKSTLVAHLTEKVDPAQLTVGKVVTSALDSEELIHVIAQSFGLEVEGRDKAAALGAIELFLQDEAREGRRCLLVVDECQNLDIAALEELRMLSNFQLGSHPLLQTLLLGQPEFRKLVAEHEDLEQLRQRVIASHHLSALEEDEVEEYVRYRLEMVGWKGNPEITEDVYSELYNATGGIPRRINQVMNRLLLLGSIEERAGFTVKMLDDVCAEMVLDAEQGAQNAEPAETSTAATLPAMSMDGDLKQALAEMTQRLDDQEASVRHVLTLLVEWFEEENQREAA